MLERCVHLKVVDPEEDVGLRVIPLEYGAGEHVA